MKNLITQKIKDEIIKRLVGSSIPFKGQQKKVKKFTEWWRHGIKFEKEFDLASIPVNGPISINVHFDCWSIIEIDSQGDKKVSITANFGPILVVFRDKNYNIDCSDAAFSLFQVG